MQYYWNLCVFVGRMNVWNGMEGEMCNTFGISACLLEEWMCGMEWRVRCAILLESLRVIATNMRC